MGLFSSSLRCHSSRSFFCNSSMGFSYSFEGSGLILAFSSSNSKPQNARLKLLVVYLDVAISAHL